MRTPYYAGQKLIVLFGTTGHHVIDYGTRDAYLSRRGTPIPCGSVVHVKEDEGLGTIRVAWGGERSYGVEVDRVFDAYPGDMAPMPSDDEIAHALVDAKLLDRARDEVKELFRQREALEARVAELSDERDVLAGKLETLQVALASIAGIVGGRA